MYGTCFYPKWVKNAKMRQHFLKFWQSIDFPVGSEFKNSSEGPLKYAKMTIMDILEFGDIKGLARMPEII